MDEIRKAYRTVMEDHFPQEMSIILGGQRLVFRKRTWRIQNPDLGEVIEKGLRYGDNPGQEAALYEWVGGNLRLGGAQWLEPGKGLVSAVSDEDLLQGGKHPGKINLTDVDRALQILRFLNKGPAAAIMKHNNPSGVAYGDSLCEAYERAFMADRIAAFGGALAVNRALDKAAAEAIASRYLEVVAAPEYEEGTLEILGNRRNLRILRIPRMDRLEEYAGVRFLEFTSLLDGGIILQQSALNAVRSHRDLKPAVALHRGEEFRPRREPTQAELEDIVFGWAVEQAVTSNSVLFAKQGATVAIGTGEQDRVGVAEIAIFKAYTKFKDALSYKKYAMPYKTLEVQVASGKKERSVLEEIEEQTLKEKAGLKGSVMVSDAFFPFRDGVDVAIAQGVTAIAHPGGSERDYESIQACNEAEPPVAMVFTGQRAFRH